MKVNIVLSVQSELSLNKNTLKIYLFSLLVVSFALPLDDAFANSPTDISAVDAETDGPTFTTLNGAWGVDTFTIGSSTYAIVAASEDDGVQIINISDPSNISAVDAETDGSNGFTELDQASAVDTFTIGSNTYAIVASFLDDGVQIINISDPSNIVAVDAETDGVNGFTELDGARGVDTFKIGSSTYAIVTALEDDGVQIINISDPSNIVAVDAETDGPTFTTLNGASAVDTFTVGSNTYAIVTSFNNHGVQIINISDPSNISAVDAETDGSNGFTELFRANSVDTFTIGSNTYAIVASFEDDGVQIINISDPSNISAVDAETDGPTFTTLNGARGVDTFKIGSSTYAIVTALLDDGVQIINISDPSNISAVDAETDGPTFTTLNGARSVDTFTIGTSTYAIVTATADDGVQMILLNQGTSDNNNNDDDGDDDGVGGCSSDCTPPTLGIDEHARRVVTDGFIYNGNPVDVERYFTSYPLITTEVGKANTAVFKIFENSGPQNVAHFSFAFGLAKGEIISKSRAMIELDIDYDRTQTVSITDPHNVFGDVLVEVIDRVDCNVQPKIGCLQVTIHHTFVDHLEFDIVGTDVWDRKRNAWQNYYNHGIDVIGESQNPPETKMIPGTEKGEGLIKVTQAAKYGNIWVASDGREFEENDYGSFKQINMTFERHMDSGDAKTRLHSEFEKKLSQEISDAHKVMSLLCDSCQDVPYEELYDIYWIENSYSMTPPDALDEILEYEQNRAQEILDVMPDVPSEDTP